jgi:hypothetical protein
MKEAGAPVAAAGKRAGITEWVRPEHENWKLCAKAMW